MKEKEEFVGFDSHEYRPIVRNKSMQLLKDFVIAKKPAQILEIGTFIGYSAGIMLDAFDGCHVTTLEKYEDNARDAVKNLTELGFLGRFEVVCCDAYDYLQTNQNRQFDFIFLDGPKGQYIKYLPLIKNMLKKGGILICDDILFYGLVRSNQHIEHKHRTIVNNLRKFIAALTEDEDFETQIHEFDNGISVSRKKV